MQEKDYISLLEQAGWKISRREWHPEEIKDWDRDPKDPKTKHGRTYWAAAGHLKMYVLIYHRSEYRNSWSCWLGPNPIMDRRATGEVEVGQAACPTPLDWMLGRR